MNKILLLSGLCVLLAGGLGCEAPPVDVVTSIKGAQHLSFQCVNTGDAPSVAGQPLENCGCTKWSEDDPSALELIPRIRCTCTQSDGVRVSDIRAVCDASGECTPVEDEGDWVPAGLGEDSMPCTPEANGRIRGYVGSGSTGRLMTLSLVGDVGAPGAGIGRIEDNVETIPGVTGIFVDDIITDVETDPAGRFTFTVNSSTGSLSIIGVVGEVRERVRVDLGSGPLLQAKVWPAPEQVIAVAHATRSEGGVEIAAQHLAEQSRVFVTAPGRMEVLELSAGVMATLARGGDLLEGQSLVKDCIGLHPQSNCGLRVPAGFPVGEPDALAIHPDGKSLAIGYLNRPTVVVVDLEAEEPESAFTQISLSRYGECGNGYLISVVDAVGDTTCEDTLDNDGDGVIDSQDSDCQQGGVGFEADCPQLAQCDDGFDNDGDGAIDLDDEDCMNSPFTFWERELPPECANGIDDDGDMLTDHEDPGCARQDDASEAGGALEEPGGDGAELCADGADNDGDGLIDDEDPGCIDGYAERYSNQRLAACNDGLDNDGDGDTDLADEDCYAAVDRSEGSPEIEYGPRQLAIVEEFDGSSGGAYLYALGGAGRLTYTALSEPTGVVRSTSILSNVLGFGVRQAGVNASLLVITADNVLRSLDMSTPEELTLADGRPIFARYDDWRYQTTREGLKVERAWGIAVQSFYTYDAGEAVAVDGLEDLCAVPRCSEDDAAGCWLGSACVDDVCIPSDCESETECDGGVCQSGVCALGCAQTSDCPGALVCNRSLGDEIEGWDGLCQTPCSRDSSGALNLAPETRDGERLAVSVSLGAEAVEVVNQGRSDPVVRVVDRRTALHGEANILLTAQGRTSRVTGEPNLFVEGVLTRGDEGEFPVFCSLLPPDYEALGLPPVGCLPSGTTWDGEALLDEDAEVTTERRKTRLDEFDGIRVTEEDPSAITNESFNLSYEGLLPRTASITGKHGGLVDDAVCPGWDVEPDAQARDACEGLDAGDSCDCGDDCTGKCFGYDVANLGCAAVCTGWKLLDYDRNFCSTGVEVGDVLLFDFFAPRSADLEACEPFLEDELAPTEQFERLRYVVREVGPHRLILSPDARTEYRQARRSRSVPLPALAAPPPSPPSDCAVRLLRYEVRVKNGQWLLEGSTSGYRHPWGQGDDGTCEVVASRAERKGRLRLDEDFIGEWFSFRLGTFREGVECPESLGDDCDPYMVGLRYNFRLTSGVANRRTGGAFVLPQEVRWLPANDHLYVVDGAAATVFEYQGLDVLQPDAFRLVRRFE